ncbi:MAG: HPr family phosphocarrier protein, partial [Actinobacteria bacterium]|nr:HPr family phosphocarrier protein [Actinomycetota bacterium]NIS35199.1 HPr family phosphocarrier protein [Actinomycetota bacterium]NIU69916.1 HPr family phosphocarrier protein [Actinomycetota bacterium]
RDAVVVNKLGLHARAAAVLVSTATGFAADVRLDRGGHKVDAKSIMAIMMLAAVQGTELVIETEGEDAEAAIDAITTLFSQRFGEEE